MYPEDILVLLETVSDNRYDTFSHAQICDIFEDSLDFYQIMPEILTEFDIVKKISDNEFFLNFDNEIVSKYYDFKSELNEYVLKKIDKFRKSM